VVTLLAALTLGACGSGAPGADDREARMAQEATTAAADSTGASPGEAPAPGPTAEDRTATDPFAGFGIPAPDEGPGPERRFRLRLINASSTARVIEAHAGADTVRVDSLAGGGEVRADLVTRGHELVVESRAPDGGETEVRVLSEPPDSVVTLEFGGSHPR
jgi:hypothetical protein